MPSSSAARGVIYSLICLVLLGAMPIISGLKPASMGALPFAFSLSFWQFAFSIPAFLIEQRNGRIGIFDGTMTKPAIKHMAIVTVGTGAFYGLASYLYVLGVEKAGVTNAAIAMQATPICAIILETIFLKRRKTMLELTFTAIMLAGLYYLGTSGSWKMAGLSIWFVLTLGVPALWTIAHTFVKVEFMNTPITPTQVTFFRVGMSALVLFVILMVVSPTDFATLALQALVQPFAILMGFTYFTELILWFYSMRAIDVSFASSLTAPSPVLTMILAALLLGDTIAPYQIWAGVVVLASIYGLTLAGLHKEKKKRAQPA